MVELKDQEMGDGMQCSNHPYTKNPGGICAFCLQEKLGKLVSSSFPLPKQVSSSSSSSPSFRSDSVGSSASVAGNLSAAGSLSLSLSVAKAANNTGNEGYYYNGSNGRVSHKLPFLLAKKKKKMLAASSSSANRTADIVYKRSKSTTIPRTAGVYGHDFSPRKRGGFWSFLHLYSSKHHSSSSSTTAGKKVENFNHSRPRATTTNNDNQIENGLSKSDKNEARTNQTDTGSSSSSSSSKRVGGGSCNRNGIDVIVEEDGSPNVVVTETPGSSVNGVGGNSSFERKVSRSRSVGCGSRSFSGDFFERISNGFGDCTLRRVESQREGANKAKVNSSNNPSNGGGAGMRDMVRCGGIFGGFMIMTSSSSSSSSSSWVSSSSADHQHHQNHHHQLVHGRNRSWGWAFASPMRAFTSTSTTKASSSSGKDGKRGRTITESSTGKNTTPNLNAIPSLLAVRS